MNSTPSACKYTFLRSETSNAADANQVIVHPGSPRAAAPVQSAKAMLFAHSHVPPALLRHLHRKSHTQRTKTPTKYRSKSPSLVTTTPLPRNLSAEKMRCSRISRAASGLIERDRVHPSVKASPYLRIVKSIATGASDESSFQEFFSLSMFGV